MGLDIRHDLNRLAQLPGQALHALSSVAGDAACASENGVLKLLPDQINLAPRLPSYETLDPAALAQAKARSAGLTAPQGVIAGADGRLHEPISLTVAGTKAQLIDALESSGWVRADRLSTGSKIKTTLSILDRVTGLSHILPYNYKASPVSPMLLNGRRCVMAFNKNNQNDEDRDHLRVFPTGQTDALGRPVWAIAATRDDGMHIKPQKKNGWHSVDPQIDRERNQVMTDLLKSGRVQDWSVAAGQMSAANRKHVNADYQTDHNLYQVDLANTSAVLVHGANLLHTITGAFSNAAHALGL